ncbi:4841_t:CDS:2 [Paraglomus brasilianum]|uniref:4841_t:CDS:1 n=1 Tax=Paraglomus brasilianum TaxID=144538 RepID=A0A9N9C2Q1_9GLOM|nr:4841_t:CDS:2 [Paraglomus brasilianum]
MLLSKDSCRNTPRILSTVLLILFTICCSLSAIQAVKIRGVDQSKAYLYERKGDHWTCLDGSAEILYEAINDDYCDCNDGSDEPGTSACPDNLFYCENEGHIPTYISSSRVNDGICEPECCDGSDEYGGLVQCSNVCDAAGKAYRQKMKELADLHAMGAQTKQEYIEHGKKLRSEREANLEKLQIELLAAKQRVDERKDLKHDHNPNYHDMAVKAAVSGYDEFVNERDEYRIFKDEVCNEEEEECDDHYENAGEAHSLNGSGRIHLQTHRIIPNNYMITVLDVGTDP